VADLTDIMPTLAEISGAELPKDVPFDGYSLLPVLRGEKERHRDWVYSHLDDGRVLRDSRWLLEIAKASKGGKGERFFDCGESRDGSGYKDVTNSTDPEVVAARKNFAEILATLPEPKPNSDEEPRPAAKASRQKPKSSRFATRDQNNDGTIDRAEFAATDTVKNKDAGETRFRKMDANNDGKITEDEFNTMTSDE
jgi:hypothetical protein